MSLKSFTNTCVAGLLAVTLAGCEMGDLQLNGKVFDALGVNTSSVDRKAPELKQRAGIVVPPDLSSLPEPGSGQTQQADLPVQDYDRSRTTTKADLERQQKEYCDKHYDMARAMGNQDYAIVEGPMGRCQKSILSLTDGLTGGDDK